MHQDSEDARDLTRKADSSQRTGNDRHKRRDEAEPHRSTASDKDPWTDSRGQLP